MVQFSWILFLALTIQTLLAQTWVQIWTSGGARECELKTQNLVWLMLGLSSITVPNFIFFLHLVLWATLDFQSGRIRRRTLTDIKDAYAPLVLSPFINKRFYIFILFSWKKVRFRFFNIVVTIKLKISSKWRVYFQCKNNRDENDYWECKKYKRKNIYISELHIQIQVELVHVLCVPIFKSLKQIWGFKKQVRCSMWLVHIYRAHLNNL